MGKKLSEMTLEELWQLFPIILTEHKSCWSEWYKDEIAHLKTILPTGTEYEHIGSTAVKGIMAKPIVDILITVNSTEEFKKAADILQYNGYIVFPYIVSCALVKESARLDFCGRDEVFFRDYLNCHPDAAKEYEQLKLKLWQKYEHNRDAYTDAKTDFVKKYTDIAKQNHLEK